MPATSACAALSAAAASGICKPPCTTSGSYTQNVPACRRTGNRRQEGRTRPPHAVHSPLCTSSAITDAGLLRYPTAGPALPDAFHSFSTPSRQPAPLDRRFRNRLQGNSGQSASCWRRPAGSPTKSALQSPPSAAGRADRAGRHRPLARRQARCGRGARGDPAGDHHGARDLVPNPPRTSGRPGRSAIQDLRHGRPRRRPRRQGRGRALGEREARRTADPDRKSGADGEIRPSPADLAVAEAELARLKAGFRAETIAVRKAQTERAEAEVTLAQQTYDRKRRWPATMTRRKPISIARPRELCGGTTRFGTGPVRYNEAVAGYTREDAASPSPRSEAAEGRVETIKSLVDQMVVVAPADSPGLSAFPSRTANSVLPGIPLISLVDLGDMSGYSSICAKICCATSRSERSCDVRVPALHDQESSDSRCA